MSMKREHSSSDEEEDYMSEQFLQSLEKNDVRPGLVFSKSKERQYEKEKKATRLKQEQVEAKTVKPIDSSNKGFKLLEKMGFGKSEDPVAKKLMAVKPIEVEVKSDKLGLGAMTVIREAKEERTRRARAAIEHKDALSREEFQACVSERKRANLVLVDLFKSQDSCYQLDTNNDISDPVERWYWPRAARKPLESDDAKDDDAVDDEDEQEDPEKDLEHENTLEKLEQLTEYLREKYFYCHWCGVKYESTADIVENCPGNTRTAHDD